MSAGRVLAGVLAAAAVGALLAGCVPFDPGPIHIGDSPSYQAPADDPTASPGPHTPTFTPASDPDCPATLTNYATFATVDTARIAADIDVPLPPGGCGYLVVHPRDDHDYDVTTYEGLILWRDPTPELDAALRSSAEAGATTLALLPVSNIKMEDGIAPHWGIEDANENRRDGGLTIDSYAYTVDEFDPYFPELHLAVGQRLTTLEIELPAGCRPVTDCYDIR
jgi:hypothetical protein